VNEPDGLTPEYVRETAELVLMRHRDSLDDSIDTASSCDQCGPDGCPRVDWAWQVLGR
jgi:hypothetical protein